MQKKKYVNPEITAVALTQDDILSGSDVLINGMSKAPFIRSCPVYLPRAAAEKISIAAPARASGSGTFIILSSRKINAGTKAIYQQKQYLIKRVSSAERS